MFSPCKFATYGLLFLGAFLSAAGFAAEPDPAPAAGEQPAAEGTAEDLCICADPNNMPFSDDKLEGFENELAQLIGDELHRKVTYYWWPQRRGFIRNTLRAGKCDLVIGIPSSFELALPTRPYYRSTYVFVSRKDKHLDIKSFDDPALHVLKIGVHVIGDDYTNVPPAQALAKRGIIGNVSGYSIYGDYSKDSPPRDLINAVAAGEIDIAVAWGPLAGYYARQSSVPLTLQPVSPQIDLPFLPLVYDISMGVRREDTALRDQINEILVRRAADIQDLLDRFGVPLMNQRPRQAQLGKEQ